MHHHDLAAVVSDTRIRIYDPARENVLAHELVNETVMHEYTVIPRSFGTIRVSAFMGDLNAEPDSEVARALCAAGFSDAFELAGLPAPPTSPASQPCERIAWIWVRGHDVTEAEVSSGGGSDHRLVAARVRLR